MKIVIDEETHVMIAEYPDGSARLLKQGVKSNADKFEAIALVLEQRGVLLEVRKRKEQAE